MGSSRPEGRARTGGRDGGSGTYGACRRDDLGDVRRVGARGDTTPWLECGKLRPGRAVRGVGWRTTNSTGSIITHLLIT